MADLKLTQIYVYPIKGCRGIALESGVVCPTGLLWDRNWVVVRASSGKFLTQRQKPMLALVEVAIVPDRLLEGADLAGCPDAKLVLRAPGMPELQVPVTPSASSNKQLVPVTVWGWSGQAADEGDAAAEWFSRYLGLPCRLLRYAGQPGAPGSPGDPTRRDVNEEWAPPNSETAFADGYPYLLANEASLAALNQHLAAKGEPPLPINRFRPNLVVAGAGAFDEDSWRSLRFGAAGSAPGDGVEFDNVKPCDRCKVTTINQATAEEGLEPLVALQETRSGRVLGWEHSPSWRASVFFAWNMVARQRGVVRVGDTVAVTATRQGPPVPSM